MILNGVGLGNKASFIKKITAMTEPTPFEGVFWSHKQIESDLLFLTNYTDNSELTKLINQLKSSQPRYKYSNFEPACSKHHGLVIQFKDVYLQRKEVLENLHKIYLQIASKQKEPHLHWLYQKETYADLTRCILKVPVEAVSLMASIAFLLTISFYFLTPLILLNLTVDPFIFLIGMLVWVGSLFANYYYGIPFQNILNDFFHVIHVQETVAAKFIDWMVDTTFNTKPHASELGCLLDLANDNQAIQLRFAIADPLIRLNGK